jgi:seryl-tRNA synthetase
MRTKLERYAEESSKSQAKALNDALQKAGKAEAPSDLSSEEQQELEKLISETQELMSQANSAYGQEIQQSLRSRMPDRKTLENMKKAMEDYKAGKAESEKALQNLEKSLANAQKGITSGTHKVVTDSTLTERELEKGKGGVDDGPGTTNEDVGPQHFDTKKKGISEYVEDRTKAQYEQLYQGQREKAGGEPLFLDGEWNTGEAKQMRMRTFG